MPVKGCREALPGLVRAFVESGIAKPCSGSRPSGNTVHLRERGGHFIFFGLIVGSRPARGHVRGHVRPSTQRVRPGRPYEHSPHPASPRR
jgi:hypothetical protein